MKKNLLIPTLVVLLTLMSMGTVKAATGITVNPGTIPPGGSVTITITTDTARTMTDYVVVDPTTTIIWRAVHPGPDLIPGTADDPGTTIGGPGGAVLALPAGATLVYVFPGPNFATSIAGDTLSGPGWGGTGGVAPNTLAQGYYTAVAWCAVGPIWQGGFWSSFFVIPEFPLGTLMAVVAPLAAMAGLATKRRLVR